MVHPQFLCQPRIDCHIKRTLFLHDNLLEHFIDTPLEIFSQVASDHCEKFVYLFFQRLTFELQSEEYKPPDFFDFYILNKTFDSFRSNF